MDVRLRKTSPEIVQSSWVGQSEDFWEAEAGGSGVEGQSALYTKFQVMQSFIVGVGLTRGAQLLRVRSRDKTIHPTLTAVVGW